MYRRSALDHTCPAPSARLPVSLEVGLAGVTGRSAAPPRFSRPRNPVCLSALVAIALFLAGTLDPSRFAVLEDADYALTTRGISPAAGPSHRRRYA